MHLEFHGAARTVTGSCFLLRVNGKRILIDCGMFQGGKNLQKRNRSSFAFAPKSIDYILITHAHIDHSGRLPKLVKDGYSGPIISTRATVDLLELMLLDSAHIQEMDAIWTNRKAKRAGKPLIEPLYTTEDAQQTLSLLSKVKYEQEIDLCDGVKLKFRDAGHILGSAFIELWATEKGVTRKFVFSGDVGNMEQAIIRDPQFADSADVLLVESTYGNRNHKARRDTLKELADILVKSYDEGGNIVIPAFAVGRSQEILYQLRQLYQEGRLPDYRVYIDSPMAISATEIYRKHSECFDDETVQILLSGEGPFHLPNVQYTRGTEQSRAINFSKGPNIIISASGMCDAGRILHHLKHNLWRRNAHIIFVGFQAEGSMGWLLINGRPRVKIFREEIAVSAKIHTIGGLSAHADQRILLEWIGKMAESKPLTYIVHGEEEPGTALAKKLGEEYGIKASLPLWHETVEF